MKKIINGFFFTVLGITTGMAQAPVATLEHNGQTTPFYGASALTDAVNAAVKNDVIYLSTGNFDSPTISKTLKIVGAGHYADSSKVFLRTNINGIITLNAGSDSVHLEGLNIGGNINCEAGAPISGVRIFRCNLGNINFNANSAATSKDFFTISESILGSLYCSKYCNHLTIINNITTGELKDIHSATISNNILLLDDYWPGGGDLVRLFQRPGVYNTLISNNIIYGTHVQLTYASYCLFKNNLFASGADFGTNTSVDNYIGVGQSNIFISQTYHLKNPTQFLGDDGTEVGIYGGMSPYKEKAIPTNPYIEQNVISSKTDLNGNLQINIKAKAQNK